MKSNLSQSHIKTALEMKRENPSRNIFDILDKLEQGVPLHNQSISNHKMSKAQAAQLLMESIKVNQSIH